MKKSKGLCATTAEGDTILVKRDDTKKESNTPYYQRPRTVVEKKRSTVTAVDDDGVPVTSNSSFFKSVRKAKEAVVSTQTVAVGCRTPETLPAAYANTPSL